MNFQSQRHTLVTMLSSHLNLFHSVNDNRELTPNSTRDVITDAKLMGSPWSSVWEERMARRDRCGGHVPKLPGTGGISTRYELKNQKSG